MFERAQKLEKIFRRHPQVPLFARLAERHLRRGRLARAQSLCEQGCQRFPEYATGFLLLGRCYARQKLWEEARSAFDRCLRIDPDNPAGYRRLARAYRELGNDTLALKCLERAAAIDPLSNSLNEELASLAAQTRRSMAPVPTVDVVSTPRPVVGDTGDPAERGLAAEQVEPALTPSTNGEADHGDEVAVEPFAAPGSADRESVDETETAPVDETDTAPVDETDTAPVDETDTAPVDETETAPVDETDTAPVDETDTAPVDETELAEPFGQVLDQPEWDDEETEPAVIETQTEPPGPETAPPGTVSSAAETDSLEDDEIDLEEQDEVAALGAGLFDDEEEEEKPAPAPKKQTTRPVAPAAARPKAPPPAEPLDIGELESEAGWDDAAEPEAPSEPARSSPEPAAPATTARVEPQEAEPVRAPTLAGQVGDLATLLEAVDDTDVAPIDDREAEVIPTMTLAQLYARQGYAEQAVEIYTRILRDDPANEAAQQAMAELGAT